MYSQKQVCLLTFFDSFQSHFLLSLFETIKERRTKLYLDQDIKQCQKGSKNSNQFQKSCENNYSVVNYFPIFFYTILWTGRLTILRYWSKKFEQYVKCVVMTMT